MLWAALFAGVAGYVDAICYFLPGVSFGGGAGGGAFAANMTGNLVVVGIDAARGHGARVAWLVTILVSFFIGISAARVILAANGSSRILLLIEAGLIALAATDQLGLVEVPVVAAAMALQNQAARHSGLDVNVGFVTGDIQQLGAHLVRGSPPMGPQPTGRPRVILSVLTFYAVGAAVGTVATAVGVAMLGVAAALIAAAGLLPARWRDIPQRH